jgi:hypothetical protein
MAAARGSGGTALLGWGYEPDRLVYFEEHCRGLKQIMKIQPRSQFCYGPSLPAESYSLREDLEEKQNLAAARRGCWVS